MCGHLVDQRRRGRRITVHEPGQVSEIDGESDEILLDAIMQGPLDRSSVGVGGIGHAPSRRAKLRYLSLKSIDNLRQLLTRASSRHSHLFPGVAGRCPTRQVAGPE